jgi:hypothetical protein
MAIPYTQLNLRHSSDALHASWDRIKCNNTWGVSNTPYGSWDTKLGRIGYAVCRQRVNGTFIIRARILQMPIALTHAINTGCQSSAVVRSMFEINIRGGHGFDSRSNPFLSHVIECATLSDSVGFLRFPPTYITNRPILSMVLIMS